MLKLVFAVLLATVLLAAVTEAVVCNRTATESKAGSGGCISHSLAGSCGDGTNCQCVASVFELCKKTNTGSWKRGNRVLDNCNTIPAFTAIATFKGKDGKKYDGEKDGSHAAIFKQCVYGANGRPNGVKVYDQWCRTGPFQLRTTSSYDFYVIL
jgi:hypothetical protein